MMWQFSQAMWWFSQVTVELFFFCDRDQERLDTIRKRAFAKVRSGFTKTKDDLFLCFIVTNLFCKMSLVITIFLVTQHRLAQEIWTTILDHACFRPFTPKIVIYNHSLRCCNGFSNWRKATMVSKRISEKVPRQRKIADRFSKM